MFSLPSRFPFVAPPLLLLLSLLCCTTIANAWEFRFSSTNIIEVRRDAAGIYGTICDDEMTIDRARGLCQSMGVNSNPNAVWYFNRDGTSSAGIDPRPTTGVPIWMVNVSCPRTATAGNFETQCTMQTNYPQTLTSCSHSEDLGLFCFPWSLSIDPVTKVLFVRPGMNSDPLLTTPGTVCASGGTPPDKQTALSLCKLVGFSSTATLEYSKAYYATPGSTSASTPIYLRNVNSCPTTTPNPGFSQITLEQCSMEYFPALTGANSGCNGHLTDVALTCQQQDVFPHPGNPTWQVDIQSSATSGNPVIVRPNSTAPWGTICSDRMTRDTATAICRMYNGGTIGNGQLDMTRVYASWSTSAASTKYGSGTIYIDELRCPATSTSMGACQYIYSDVGQRRNDCDHAEDTVVFCDVWQFSEEPGTRRLLVRPTATPNNLQYGTVCGDGFGIDEARAVCRFLGYTDGIDKVNFALYGTGTNGQTNPNGLPIYWSSVDCPADATTLQQCTFRRNAAPSNLQAKYGLANGCAHTFDIKIDCNGTSGTPAPEAPGLFTSEILIAIFTPLVIILFIVVFLVVRYFTREQARMEDESATNVGNRSPASQALTGFTSIANAPIRSASGNFGPSETRRKNGYVDDDAFGISSSANRLPNKKSSTQQQQPNFEVRVADSDDDDYEMSPRGRGRKKNQRSNGGATGGVERPLPPQRGSAAISNPFGRNSSSLAHNHSSYDNNNSGPRVISSNHHNRNTGASYSPNFGDDMGFADL